MCHPYDVLLVPLYIFAPHVCLFVQMLQRSILVPIGDIPNIFSLILGILLVTFCYFLLLFSFIYCTIFDIDRCGRAEISICT